MIRNQPQVKHFPHIMKRFEWSFVVDSLVFIEFAKSAEYSQPGKLTWNPTKNGGLEDDFPFQLDDSCVSMLIFRGVFNHSACWYHTMIGSFLH